jgi:hypothetical protein
MLAGPITLFVLLARTCTWYLMFGLRPMSVPMVVGKVAEMILASEECLIGNAVTVNISGLWPSVYSRRGVTSVNTMPRPPSLHSDGTLVGPSNFTVKLPSMWLTTLTTTGALGVWHEQKHGRTGLLIAVGLDPKLFFATIFTL